MRPLRWISLWLTLGWAYAGLIVYFSLTSSPPAGPEIPQLDKAAHLAGYALLAGWFMQLVEKTKLRLLHLLIFAAMGGCLEILQGLGGIRHAEWMDMLANLLGVVLGWQLSRVIKLPLQ